MILVYTVQNFKIFYIRLCLLLSIVSPLSVLHCISQLYWAALIQFLSMTGWDYFMDLCLSKYHLTKFELGAILVIMHDINMKRMVKVKGVFVTQLTLTKIQLIFGNTIHIPHAFPI